MWKKSMCSLQFSHRSKLDKSLWCPLERQSVYTVHICFLRRHQIAIWFELNFGQSSLICDISCGFSTFLFTLRLAQAVIDQWIISYLRGISSTIAKSTFFLLRLTDGLVLHYTNWMQANECMFSNFVLLLPPALHPHLPFMPAVFQSCNDFAHLQIK